ncbi:hypothetical protein TAF16_2740 [Anoxybacillus flavithermus]|uniref:Uncharacterized protein n=1 Tax=Anoxybacillus flavithermus TaxID=33934 RepID=A0A178T4R2_9BACL|nr:hypothetical protein TAF16_2740 [Anoxybacillus flavithermus]
MFLLNCSFTSFIVAQLLFYLYGEASLDGDDAYYFPAWKR